MSSEQQRILLEEKLALIEKEILDDNNREEAQRIPARHFMVFLLIGGNDETVGSLKLKVQSFISNPKACAFLRVDESGEKNLGDKLGSILLNAAQSYVDVEDLNTILLCPVLFSSEKNNSSFDSALQSVQSYAQMAGKIAVWQPFLIIDSGIKKYPEIYKSIIEMQRFITARSEQDVHRCCILSNQDERGFAVPMENILETVAICSILQNTKPENSDVASVISQKVCIEKDDAEKGRVFFTARSASVSNPIRSLTYQRMISSVNFLAGKTDAESKNALNRVRFGFVKETIGPYIDSLPHLNGNISFFPLYGVVEGENLHQRLQKQIDKYYLAPLYGKNARIEITAKIWEKFFYEYFRNNGSLQELEHLISSEDIKSEMNQHMGEWFWDMPIEERPKKNSVTRSFLSGEYEQARNYCEMLIKDFGKKQMEGLVERLQSNETLKRIEEVQEKLNAVVRCMEDRKSQLRDIETILEVDQSELHSSFDAVQDNWFEICAQTDEKIKQLNRRFDSMICEMLLKGTDDFSDILRVCYEAVKTRIENNAKYLQKLDEVCSRTPEKAKLFAKKVEQSWCYTLRVIRAREAADVTFLIGNRANSFCKELEEQFKAKQFEFSGFDRLCVLHISTAFEAANIFSWAEIEKSGKKEGAYHESTQ